MRELTSDEVKHYETNLKKQVEDRENLLIVKEYLTLMKDKWNLYNFNVQQKRTLAQLEEVKDALDACNLTITDCDNKLTNGVE
jgi:hypothetical protein